MQGRILIVSSIVIGCIIFLAIILYVVANMKRKYYKKILKDLEVQRNLVASTPISLELSKVEPIIKNDKMEEKYNKWQEKFLYIKEKRLTLIDDMFLDLDAFIDKKDYKICKDKIAKIEIEIYKVNHSRYARFIIR